MGAPDVLIVGGGAVGCASAYFLARAGLSVGLLERDGIARHASGAAAGMLAPICESSGDGVFFELGVRSLRMFPALCETLRELSGVDPQYVPSGVLRVAQSPVEADHLRRQAARVPGHGLEWLDREAALAREARIGPEAAGALWSPEEAHVLSPMLVRAYAGAAGALGATIEEGVPVLDLVRQGGRITGVVTPEGPRAAGTVLLCGGAWTRFCGDWLDLRWPVEPIRGQILSLEGPRPALRSIVWGEGAYLVPKLNGSLVVGATEERAGFDCRTTASGVGTLLEAAARLVPELSGATFLSAWAGLRPATPDHLPGIGPVPGVDGLLLAAGHYRNGVLLSPVTGELVAACLRGDAGPVIPRALLPERWAR